MIRCVLLIAACLKASTAVAAEVCRYSGTTSHSGHVVVETKASTANGETTVDVAARVSARSFGLLDWQYLYQEIGIFRNHELQQIAINHRYRFAGSTRRQQWDVFTRGPDGMSAYRVQAKTLADFQARHPGFARHWDFASFGDVWLPDYVAASPERRADLDLPKVAMPPGLGAPLIQAFYGVRWAGQEPRSVPIFLPGFKKNARTDVQVTTVGVETNGLLHLRSSVRHPQLSESQVSTGDAWIAPDHRLLRVTFDARGDLGRAEGDVHLDGCQGEAPAP